MGNYFKFAQIAKDLRRRSTDSEKILWSHLRKKQLEGFKFRRQQVIGRFIVDFACFETKLVIEVDGGQHSIDKEKDQERDRWLRTQGFQVLRFWNNDVLGNIEGVMEAIGQRMRPLPQGEG